MQALPDYSSQLNQIVTLLNRPVIPGWVIAALSAVLGMLGGLLGQIVLLRVNDRHQRYRMRRVLYTDLGGNFMMVYSTMMDNEFKGDEKARWQQLQFESSIKFDVENYLKQKPDVYMQLTEHYSANELYYWLHNIINRVNRNVSNPGMFCQIFAEYVVEGRFKEKYFRKFDGPEKAARMMTLVAEVNKQVAAVKEAVAEGKIKLKSEFEP
jgi:hypothetical protein